MKKSNANTMLTQRNKKENALLIPTPDQVKKCPKCMNDVILKQDEGALYYGCTNFPACKYSEKLHND